MGEFGALTVLTNVSEQDGQIRGFWPLTGTRAVRSSSNTPSDPAESIEVDPRGVERMSEHRPESGSDRPERHVLQHEAELSLFAPSAAH